MISFNDCQLIASMSVLPPSNSHIRHVLGLPIDYKQMCCIASAICGELVDDFDQAYEILLIEFLQMGHELLPASRVSPESGIEEPVFLICFFENKAESPEENAKSIVAKCRIASLTLRLWLQDRGVPEADHIPIMRKIYKLA